MISTPSPVQIHTVWAEIVEKPGCHVEDNGRSDLLHFADTERTASSRLSSTGGGRIDASVHGHCTLSSPASTVAMTTDENLKSQMDIEQNDQHVDCVDRPRAERS